MAPGDTVLWRAGATHDFGAIGGDDPWELIWTHFYPREHWRGWLEWPTLGRGIAWIPAPPHRLRARIDGALIEMDSHTRSGLAQASELGLNALERALLWLAAANPRPAMVNESVQEAVLFISRHLDRRLSVREVADAIHLSPSRLTHLFTQHIGVPVAQFIEQRRMEIAKALLQSSSLPIGAVADAAGFSSQFYFAARFRVRVGMTPSEWRNRGRQ